MQLLAGGFKQTFNRNERMIPTEWRYSQRIVSTSRELDWLIAASLAFDDVSQSLRMTRFKDL